MLRTRRSLKIPTGRRSGRARAQQAIRRVSLDASAWFLWRAVQMALDGGVAAFAVLLAYLLRFDFSIPTPHVPRMFGWMLVYAVVRPMLLLLGRHYRATWRHFHLKDAMQLAALSITFTLVMGIARVVLVNGLGRMAPIPYSVLVLEFGIFVTFASCVRMSRRLIYEGGRQGFTPQLRTIVVGNDQGFSSALKHVRSFSDITVVGLLSEESRLVGYSISGYFVLGTPADLPRILTASAVDLVIIAGAVQRCVTDVVTICADYGAQVRILPSARDLVSDQVHVNRRVTIDEIAATGDEQAPEAAHEDVRWAFRDRTVLVTGAGGSIGSEICRQAVRLPIRELILLDQDENSIFELMNQLPSSVIRVVPRVGDICDRETMREIFGKYRPNIVLHAAAYKHVPVMECNPAEAVLNNVLGTRALIEQAVAGNCERFVMISTDKAVRPSSVMGATKRAAELLVQHQASRNLSQGTQFACVRFGNVMGSRGSVLPIFLKQIAEGGPVTITHEEMTRYFMTIPQAVQLVMQAATLASTGDIFMLDMGDPVKIVDLAKKLIRMTGLRPGEDIPIKIVGARPGEKLHEQLWREDSTVNPTTFPFVHRVMTIPELSDFPELLDQLIAAALSRAEDERICEMFKRLPLDYQSVDVREEVAS